MEDLWDETIFEEIPGNQRSSFTNAIPASTSSLESSIIPKKRGRKPKNASEKIHTAMIASGDIVWVSEKDDFWWPAKVIQASPPPASSNGSSCLEVMLLNRSDEEPIKISGSNLIRPFMEMIQVMRLPPTQKTTHTHWPIFNTLQFQ